MSTYTGPSDLATDVAVKLWDNHRDCPAGGEGHCTLGHISTDDVQEVIDLAKGPVVAAELRRIADWHWGDGLSGDAICEALRARADELDPPAVRQED